MLTLPPMATAALAGFCSGLVISVPVGPVNLTLINEGARNGFRVAALIGLGATAMEVIYCAVAFTSFASFFSQGPVEAAMQVFSFAFLLFLGLRFLLASSVPQLDAIEQRLEARIEQRLHPHSAFMTGLVRTMANPGVLLGWIVLGANFISRGWIEPNHRGKLACLAGVALGVGGWFLGLSWAVSLGHKRLTERTLVRLERASGLILLGLGLAHGLHLAWQLARPHHAL